MLYYEATLVAIHDIGVGQMLIYANTEIENDFYSQVDVKFGEEILQQTERCQQCYGGELEFSRKFMRFWQRELLYSLCTQINPIIPSHLTSQNIPPTLAAISPKISLICSTTIKQIIAQALPTDNGANWLYGQDFTELLYNLKLNYARIIVWRRREDDTYDKIKDDAFDPVLALIESQVFPLMERYFHSTKYWAVYQQRIEVDFNVPAWLDELELKFTRKIGNLLEQLVVEAKQSR